MKTELPSGPIPADKAATYLAGRVFSTMASVLEQASQLMTQLSSGHEVTYEEVRQLGKGKGSGKAVRVKKEKDPNMPPRNKSSFLHFAADRRPLLKAKGLTFTEIGHVLGEEWKKISESEKKKYDILAEKDKNRFKEALKEYQETGETPVKKRKLEDGAPESSRKKEKKEVKEEKKDEEKKDKHKEKKDDKEKHKEKKHKDGTETPSSSKKEKSKDKEGKSSSQSSSQQSQSTKKK